MELRMIDFDKAFEEVDEMLQNAKQSNLFNDVKKEIQENQSYIDETMLRRGRDWSKIGNQVVGMEE